MIRFNSSFSLSVNITLRINRYLNRRPTSGRGRPSLSCSIQSSTWLAVVLGIRVLAAYYLAELDKVCHANEYGGVVVPPPEGNGTGGRGSPLSCRPPEQC